VSSGYVVDETALEGARARGDTASVTPTIGPAEGSTRLEQRVLRFAPGRSAPCRDPARDDTMYVVAGKGRVELDDGPHELEADTSVFLAAGQTAVLESDGDQPLVLVSVLAPAGGGEARSLVVHLSDRPEQRADAKRTFRVLLDRDAGCPDLTQFVGVVEPFRAPDHSHPYDEVGYVLAGRGFAHLNGKSIPIGPGSCFHLPPGIVHCIENIGPDTMRILGVFHPSDSPASRLYDAAGEP
jgi:quercetin dioxygenase-like cupin family protein